MGHFHVFRESIHGKFYQMLREMNEDEKEKNKKKNEEQKSEEQKESNPPEKKVKK